MDILEVELVREVWIFIIPIHHKQSRQGFCYTFQKTFRLSFSSIILHTIIFVTNSSFPQNHTQSTSKSSHQCDSELHSNNSLWTKLEFNYVLFPVHSYFITFKPMKSEITNSAALIQLGTLLIKIFILWATPY